MSIGMGVAAMKPALGVSPQREQGKKKRFVNC
jgi:hypothetical protein